MRTNTKRAGTFGLRTLILILMVSGSILAQESTGTFTVYRYKMFKAGGLKATIFVDGVKTVSISNGGVESINVTPGKHTITGPNKNRGAEIAVEPGKIYYFKVEPLPWARWEFTAVSPEQASFEMSKLQAKGK